MDFFILISDKDSLQQSDSVHMDINDVIRMTQETDPFWIEQKELLLRFCSRSVFKFVNLQRYFSHYKIGHYDDLYLWMPHTSFRSFYDKRLVDAIPNKIKEMVITGRIT